MNYKFVLVDTTTGKDVAEWILPPPVTVGRCSTTEVTLGDVSISRRHCQFFLDPYGSLVVRDLASKNGIYVDERRVDKAVVIPGTEVRIGKVTMRVELTDEEMDSGPEPADILDLDETQPMKIIEIDPEFS
ncbi:FHA domain-containing protein [Novipirellula artificiosorum]|uniref:Glycogen accumulation regulator GarA n=1 Tax=Novipirellula artificiosorum TaxID=2528016 RepID=A0A5C6DWS8_9BACT|nr:FHA domain-containing protein [Novipirellula artificiosorum]TWU41108.1 Glycogen accumulation regulator GarA [Novipirellula artificiosorum]